MGFSEEHIATATLEAQEAAREFEGHVQTSRELAAEFLHSDPEVARIYRNWTVCYLKKLDYFSSRLEKLQGENPHDRPSVRLFLP